MSAFAEGFPHEDFFMQQARRNGIEIGVSDPSVATAGLITFISGLVNAKTIVEIGTGSGVGALAIFRGATSDSTITSIDSDRENTESAREIFDEAGISPQRFRLINGNIINYTDNDSRRIDMIFELSYSANVAQAKELMLSIIQEEERILKERGILIKTMVFFTLMCIINIKHYT